MAAELHLPPKPAIIRAAELPRPEWRGFGPAPTFMHAGTLAKEFSLTNSGLFTRADSDVLLRTFGAGGDRRQWTLSIWFRRGASQSSNQDLVSTNGSDDASFFDVRFTTANKLQVGNWNAQLLLTTATFTSTTDWVHLVLVFDSPNATGADRIRLYIDLVRVTAFDTNTVAANISQNFEGGFNSNRAHAIGRQDQSGGNYIDANLAGIDFVGGQALAPTSFARLKNSVPVPAKYKGAYGTNGHRLDFADNTSLGLDTSGQENDWTNTGVTQSLAHP